MAEVTASLEGSGDDYKIVELDLMTIHLQFYLGVECQLEKEKSNNIFKLVVETFLHVSPHQTRPIKTFLIIS